MKIFLFLYESYLILIKKGLFREKRKRAEKRNFFSARLFLTLMRVAPARRKPGRESDRGTQALTLPGVPAVPERPVPVLRLRESRAGRRAAPRNRQVGRRVDPSFPCGVPPS